MCVYLPDIMVTYYVCIPTRYNGLLLCVYTYTRYNGHLLAVYLPDIMVTLYGCIPTRYNGHSLWVYTNQI